MKRSLIVAIAAGSILVFFGASSAFNLGGFLDKIEKDAAPLLDKVIKEKPPKQQQPAPRQPRQERRGGGLIDMGESLGIIDKKTSKTLRHGEKIVRQGKKTLDAFKPIGLEEEKAIGASLAMEVFKRFGGPYEDPRLLRYVNMVGQAVARVSDRPNIDYHFAILDSEAPNGFATPGGYVFVSIGLLRMLKNEAELAGALGHEIAHITHKHALKTIQRSKELHGVNALTMTVMEKDPSKFNKLIDEVSNVIFTHGLDKNLEYEADKMGMEYAARVGYQPNGLNEFIRVLGSSPAGKTSIFFSTHPAPRDRVSRLRKLLSAKRRANASPVLANRFETEVKERL